MKSISRIRRHKRITKKVKGSSQKLRLVVFRSKKHIYVQAVNDQENKVITAASTLEKEFKKLGAKTTDKEAAKKVGRIMADKLKAINIKRISFDRAGYKYHGRVKALADSLREGGLIF